MLPVTHLSGAQEGCSCVILQKKLKTVNLQDGALNFSHVGPAINHTQASLEAVKSSQSPLKKLQEDIKPEGRLGGLELKITDNDKNILCNLLSAYVSGLAKNISSRFNDCLSILSSCSIVSPVALPKPTKILADHFFKRRRQKTKKSQSTTWSRVGQIQIWPRRLEKSCLPWNLFWLTKAPSEILLLLHWMQSNTIETCWRTTAKGSVLGKEGFFLAWPGLGFRQWQCMG